MTVALKSLHDANCMRRINRPMMTNLTPTPSRRYCAREMISFSLFVAATTSFSPICRNTISGTMSKRISSERELHLLNFKPPLPRKVTLYARGSRPKLTVPVCEQYSLSLRIYKNVLPHTHSMHSSSYTAKVPRPEPAQMILGRI